MYTPKTNFWLRPCIVASRGFSELIKNVIRSFRGHSTPSLKISCKSVQPFSRNLDEKETNKQRKKQRNKQRNRSKTIPSPYRGRGNNRRSSLLKLTKYTNVPHRHFRIQEQQHVALASRTRKRAVYVYSPGVAAARHVRTLQCGPLLLLLLLL